MNNTDVPLLQVKDLGFSFAPDNCVLAGITLSLKQGGYLSIIGPNGAGKTTLLRCLLRLNGQGENSGEVLLRGQNLKSLPQRDLARLLAYVPQAGGWIPPFTVVEFLRLSRFAHTGGRRAGPEDRTAVETALQLTAMENLSGRALRNLSGGERQKAYLAAALAQGAPLLLLDEPAAFLDPRHGAELNALLRTLNREQGLTMLTVTHDLNHPLLLGGEALVLRDGRQLYFGAAEGLRDLTVLNRAFDHQFSSTAHPRDGRAIILAD